MGASRYVLAFGAFAGLNLGWASTAHAGSCDDSMSPRIVASPCGDADLSCAYAPMGFEKKIELPFAFNYDTGWIPGGSPLQVRFAIKMPAETEVKLVGELEANWPDAITLSAPTADVGGGYLGFDYGLETIAQAKFQVSVAGQNIGWTGNVPFIPQINFHVIGKNNFNAWAFSPEKGVATGFTPTARLFSVNILGLSGIPSAVASGGIALDVKGELKATYVTDSIEITPFEASETPIVTQTGTTKRAFMGGGYAEYSVHPEGTVHYDGTLHIIPTFYIKVLTFNFDIPITDFPITVPIADQDFVFDDLCVHVPLPDLEPIETVMDFGQVQVGDGKRLSVELSNVGEATAKATGLVEKMYADSFKILSPSKLIDPSMQKDFEVRFTPKKAGKIETQLTFVTNDPDARLMTVTMRGEGVGNDIPGYGGQGGMAGMGGSGGTSSDASNAFSSDSDGGCGCRTASSTRSAGGTFVGLSLLGLVWVARRRRAGAREIVSG